MVLSHAERDDLIARVERKLAHPLARGRVSRAVVADAVDRVAGALAAREPAAERPMTIVAVVAAESTPDLASRLRRALKDAGASIGKLGSATEGRHTVVTLEIENGKSEALLTAAGRLGARAVLHGGIA
jgi:hypothetical protein